MCDLLDITEVLQVEVQIYENDNVIILKDEKQMTRTFSQSSNRQLTTFVAGAAETI